MGHITHLNNSSCISFENFKYETHLNHCKSHKISHIFQDMTIHKTEPYFYEHHILGFMMHKLTNLIII